jgi:serine/threonine protein kinase
MAVLSLQSKIPREVKIDYALFEEVAIYSVSEDGNSSSAAQTQVCIAIERPQLTLGGVVSGMLGNEDCQTNEEVRKRYAMKVFSVLRVVCKALSSLHADGLVHGNLSVTHIGKYDSKWKVAEVLGLQRVGTMFDPDQFSPSSPPESLIPRRTNSGHEVAFRTDLETNTAIDIWGFGKLAFEALVGEPLVLFDEKKEFDDDHRALMDILHWNEFNLEEVAYKLRRSAVPEEGVNLVVACLSPTPTDRPSVEAVLNHALWKEIRRQSK